MSFFNRILKPLGLRTISKGKSGQYSRMYAAAKASRLTADWIFSGAAPRDEILTSITTIRNRARQASHDNDHAKAFLRKVVVNVIGDAGIGLQVKAKEPNGSLDNVANDMLEAAWAAWGKRGICTPCKRKSWIGVQQLAVRSMARDGEFFLRLLPGWSGNKFRFAVQALDPALLDETYNVFGGNGKPRVVMGIELGDWGEPLAYHFREEYNTGKRVRVPSSEIIHLFMEEEEGQVRACSWMASALIKMHHLNGYEEAEVIAARGAACKMGFFKTPTGDDYSPDDHESDEAPVTEAAPGIFEELPQGWEFQEYDPKHPITGFGEFVQAELRSMAAGLGVSYHTWSQNLAEANYGNLRAGLLDERDWWKVIQTYIRDALCTPVFEAWLDMALLSGVVPLPYSKLEKFNAPSWQPRRWPWVDPEKDLKAKQIEKAEGWTSDTEICAETGRDFNEIMSQRQQDRDIRKSYKEPANEQPKQNNQNGAAATGANV